METNPLSRKISAANLPLEQLSANSHLSEAEKIAGVSRHFEAVLLRQFLTEAQKPLLNSKSAMSGAQSSIYQDMMVNQLADEISKSGHFGLARSFQAQVLPTPNEDSPKQASKKSQ
jgi:Rod binding domain-containing protein